MSGPISHHARAFFPFFLCTLLLLAAAGCDDDDGVGLVVPRADIGGVVLAAGGVPASGATVYLGRDPEWFPESATIVIDSLVTDGGGRFGFDGLDRGAYRVFAGVWERGGRGYYLVSPFSDILHVEGKSAGHYERLLLQEMQGGGSVAGDVFYVQTPVPVPADSATVTLHRYQGMDFVPEGPVATDAEGRYRLTGVPTGNYAAKAFRVFEPEAPFPLYMSAESDPFFCDGEHEVTLKRMILRDVMVEKPAIYIYPETPARFRVVLELGSGFRVTASEPPYAGGWEVFVAGSGRIEGAWDYLFYEVAMPGSPRPTAGWCLPWAGLAEGLDAITTDLGLNAAEREDFLAYWKSRLPRRSFYEISPVMGADLDHWVGLAVDPPADSVLRFWLFIRGRDAAVELPAPAVPAFERTGTTVVEWGGAVRS